MTTDGPTETSPLLSANPPRLAPDLPPLDPSITVIPEGEGTPTSYGTAEASASTTDVDTPVSGTSIGGDKLGDEERRDGTPAAAQGKPEVKQQMRWIFPAVALGVFMAAADQTIIVSSYGKIGTDLNALSSTSWIATS